MKNSQKKTLGSNRNTIVEFTNERIIPASGLAVVGALLGKSFFQKAESYGCNEESFPAPMRIRLQCPIISMVGQIHWGRL